MKLSDNEFTRRVNFIALEYEISLEHAKAALLRAHMNVETSVLAAVVQGNAKLGDDFTEKYVQCEVVLGQALGWSKEKTKAISITANHMAMELVALALEEDNPALKGKLQQIVCDVTTTHGMAN